MPFRRRYSLRQALGAMTAIGVLLGILFAIGSSSVWMLYPALLVNSLTGDFEYELWLYAGGALAVVFFVGLALRSRRHRLAAVCAVLAAVAAMAFPAAQAWYVWSVVGDHTANIGYGMLMMGMPISAPISAMVGWLVAAVAQRLIWEPAGPLDEEEAR